MKSSASTAIIVLIAVIIVPVNADSISIYLDEDEFDFDITEFRELVSCASNTGDLFETISDRSDLLYDSILTDSILYTDSVERHFYYVVPSGYDPEERNPLFVWLHGGVSTPDLCSMDPEDLSEWYLIPRLLEEGYLIAFPCGQLDAVWWDEIGEEGVLRIVRRMKKNFSVDDSRVFVGGFSDGASGSFSLMMLNPSCFAAYCAFSGHMGVAAIDGGRATYLPNLSNRPGIATNSDEDGLYPAEKMIPAIALAESAGAIINYHTFQGFGHDPAYLPRLEDTFIDFLAAAQRVRFPAKILWEAGKPSGCDWLIVDSIVPWPLIGEDFDYNLLLVSDRLQFGFYPDWEYEGDGVSVSGVVDGDVPAARLELLEGDVVVGFNGNEISTLDDIGVLQEEMSAGDSFSITIQRGSEILDLTERFNPPEYYWLFPRQGPSVRIEALYSQNRFDITVNRFCQLRLLLHPEMVDFGDDITVTCNGFEVFRGPVEENGNFAMNNLMKSLDIERAYTAELKLDLEELLLPQMHEDMSN